MLAKKSRRKKKKGKVKANVNQHLFIMYRTSSTNVLAVGYIDCRLLAKIKCFAVTLINPKLRLTINLYSWHIYQKQKNLLRCLFYICVFIKLTIFNIKMPSKTFELFSKVIQLFEKKKTGKTINVKLHSWTVHLNI